MAYQSISINHFRGIDHIELNDLKKINLLVGKNNCGKSTILEAFFLLSGMSNPQLSMNVLLFREYRIQQEEDFKGLFRNTIRSEICFPK